MFVLELTENSAVPKLVGRVPPALDADFHSDNIRVCYRTTHPHFHFPDETRPELYTNTSFDREQKVPRRVFSNFIRRRTTSQ